MKRTTTKSAIIRGIIVGLKIDWVESQTVEVGSPVPITSLTGIYVKTGTNELYLSRSGRLPEIRSYLKNNNYFGRNPQVETTSRPFDLEANFGISAIS